jgi:hypothetical protein
VSPATGTGNGTVTVTAEANPLITARSATLMVSASGATSQTVTVTQLAGAATLSVTPNTLNVASSNGSSASFTVASNISWAVASNQTWLTVSLATGTGNGTVTVTAEANPLATTRSAGVTVSANGLTPRTVTVIQSINTGTNTENTGKLLIYPNPFTDGFYVNPGNSQSVLSIFDVNGRLVFSRKISGVEFIPARQFVSGFYLVVMINAKVTLREILIKL